MPYMICYWDSEDECQKERVATPAEEAEIEKLKSKASLITPENNNPPILAQLQLIDLKSIRALREGDTQRIADLESQAAALRLQLMK